MFELSNRSLNEMLCSACGCSFGFSVQPIEFEIYCAGCARLIAWLIEFLTGSREFEFFNHESEWRKEDVAGIIQTLRIEYMRQYEWAS